MIKRRSSRQTGFSLVELLIGLTIFLLVLLAVYQLFDTGSATYRSGQRKVDVQQNARVALDEIVRQIRMAGYYPENYNTDGTDSQVNPRPIHVATSTGLAVYGDLDGSCNTVPPDPPGLRNPCPGAAPNFSSSVFLYCVQTDKPTRKVYIRRVKGPPGAGNVSSYTCSGGDILAELADLTYASNSDTIIDGTAWLTFTYYDTNNALIPVPAANPKGIDGVVLGSNPDPAVMFANTLDRRRVRTVVVTLIVREDMAHQDPQIYSLTSSVRLRNVNVDW